MENEKDYKEIIEEWWKLEAKINITPRTGELRKKLINGLEFLTDEQLRFLSENADFELAGKASQVLNNKDSK